ncbi:hypothetical protein CAPTEDRAFT_215030 [Capitella teleta]|uniref:Uncharacterized protein n=1 Tax=Capitella teleta TaxID=283909 RepID=R7TEL4_CAPTE|nr:hypothetical protein CAPTEDRAFT_215030 [Capitella teleta]|eukprot:ELT92169.1 hypothetical protein CAPTEDRAFT_215030 [Capitella teleta]
MSRQNSFTNGVTTRGPSMNPAISTSTINSHNSRSSVGSPHDWFNLNKRAPSVGDSVTDGCLELGRDAGLGNVYHTRYRIRHEKQSEGVCGEMMKEEMFPCCGEKAKQSCGRFIWAIIRSEAFLFSLHLTALGLGVVKEAANYREEEEVLHLIHSIIETLVSILLVTVRIVSGWTAFYYITKQVYKIERLKGSSTTNLHDIIQGQSLRRWLKLYTFGGVLLDLFLVGTFVCFYFFAHLGWTVLTNQFALVVIGVMASLYMTRVSKTMSTNREDQHKAALYESMLLLQELQTLSASPDAKDEDKRALSDRIARFSKALRDTQMFEQPGTIELSEKYKPAYSLTMNAMMQSMV